MAAGRPKLVMTMVVRDEEDILATNLDYHLGQGVGLVLVTDHGSSDRTPEILDAYASGGRVVWRRKDGTAYHQDLWVAQMLRIATEEHAADWVLHGDADEFWVPLAGTLRDVFAAIPERYGYLRVPVAAMPPLLDSGKPFYHHMTYRRAGWLRGYPKIAQRPQAGDALCLGNHFLCSPAMDCAPQRFTVRINHFRTRSYEQLVRRAQRVEAAVDAEGPISHWRELVEVYREGGLCASFERRALDAEKIIEGLQDGWLVFDDSVARFVDERPSDRELEGESAAARAFLERVWASTTGVSLDAREQRDEPAIPDGDEVVETAGRLGSPDTPLRLSWMPMTNLSAFLVRHTFGRTRHRRRFATVRSLMPVVAAGWMRRRLPGSSRASPRTAARIDVRLGPARTTPVPVLMFHGIRHAPPSARWPDLDLPPERFRSQIQELAAAGYVAVTMREVYSHWRAGCVLPARSVVLSFDDGNRCVYDQALPVLASLGWPASLNLNLRQLCLPDGIRPEMVRQLVASGWEVESHTLTHPNLTELGDRDLNEEVGLSRRLVRGMFGVPADFFCYPSGRHDARVVAAVRAAGYLGATTTLPGLAAPVEPFRLRRVRIHADDDGCDVARRLDSLLAGSQHSPGRIEAWPPS